MPYQGSVWVPPSVFIAEFGFDVFANAEETGQWPEGYSTKEVTMAKVATEKKEEAEVPTVPIDARAGFTFGCDPELFVFKDDKPVTAEGLIPGTKAEPYKVDGGAVQVDGMAAEFNIDPTSTFKDFNHNIELVMKQLTAMLPEGHELRAVPSVTFDKEIFDAAPDKAKELGCSPDYNAWAGQVNPPPKNASNPYLRTASGHIHIGWTEGADLSDPQHILNCVDLVKQLDWYLGGWSTKVDSDPTRRQLYGRAGALRFKDYGVEYRVLSNFWITSRERRLAVWNRMQTAINALNKGFLPDRATRENNQLLQDSINATKLNAALARAFKYPLVSLTDVGPQVRVSGAMKPPFGSTSAQMWN